MQEVVLVSPHMTTRCTLCTEPHDGTERYCRCGGHFHADCMEHHQHWCPRSGTDRLLGALEF